MSGDAVIAGADLDHVAVAAEHRSDLAARYVQELGGRLGAEGPSPGFWWAQATFANGNVVEMLEPQRPEENDFLRRFLDRNGPGPHHITFTVPDFKAALASVREAGYEPVGANDSDPDWKEAFLHPKDAPGVVVQLAESHEDHPDPEPASAAAADQHAALLYACHAVRHMEEGTRLFEEVLAGTRTGEGTSGDHLWVDLAWPGPGRIRLVSPTGAGPVDAWLGNRAGRVHHLAFETDDPERVRGAHRRDDVWHVEPTDNYGTRLILMKRPL